MSGVLTSGQVGWRSRAALLAILTTFQALATGTAVAAVSAVPGHLVIIGGGSRSPSMMETIVSLAGGSESRFIVIPVASSEPEQTGDFQRDQLLGAGAGKAHVLVFDRESADRPENVAMLAQATGVFLSGGDQRRLHAALEGSKLLEALHAVYGRGGVVAGTSAGAAVMSRRMITGDELRNGDPEAAFETIESANIETWEGFDFLPGTIVDQHFVRRRRHNRLLSLVLEHPELLGIGIDESTAVVVGPPSRFRVIGDGPVIVYDASDAVVSKPDNRSLGAVDVRLHVLRAGAVFDLDARRPLLR
jgi:cyanophycinase